jgi:nitrate/nitrite transporter NarK
MLTFALFLKMSNGATYGIVPFVNTKNVGLVSGIVGAGGNWWYVVWLAVQIREHYLCAGLYLYRLHRYGGCGNCIHNPF